MSEDFKAFVGGVAWQLNDRELKESECACDVVMPSAKLEAYSQLRRP